MYLVGIGKLKVNIGHNRLSKLLVRKLLAGPYAGHGGVTRLAKDVGVARTSIYNWMDGEKCTHWRRLRDLADKHGLLNDALRLRLYAAPLIAVEDGFINYGKNQPTASMVVDDLLRLEYTGRGGVARLAKDLGVDRRTVLRWRQGEGCSLFSELMRVQTNVRLRRNGQPEIMSMRNWVSPFERLLSAQAKPRTRENTNT